MKLGRVAAAALIALSVPAVALAAGPADTPDQAAEFTTVTAENGPVGDLQSVLEMGSATPDAGVKSCFGNGGFARTAWARIPATEATQRVTVEATPQDVSTQMPDLALFVQPAGSSALALSAPGLCDGRDLYRGFGVRGDVSSAVSAVLPAGSSALVQVGWRNGDPLPPIVASLTRSRVNGSPAPRGDDRRRAPRLRLVKRAKVPARGATLGAFDPVAPNCQAPATVWRELRVRHKGVYEVSATGPAATVSAFGGSGKRSRLLGCADLTDVPRLATAFKARKRTVAIRFGVDDSSSPKPLKARALGPFSRRAKGCSRSKHAEIAISRPALSDVARGKSPYALGTVSQPCGKRGRRAASVALEIARCTSATSRCSRVTFGLASGVELWQRKTSALRPGLYRITAEAFRGLKGKGSPLDSSAVEFRVRAGS